MARVILTEPGEAVIVGGADVDVIGTAALDHISVVYGSIVLDASFASGPDWVFVPGLPTDYVATVQGSRVLLESDNLTINIPLSPHRLELQFDFWMEGDFDDGIYALQINDAGQVQFGDQIIESSEILEIATLASLPAAAEAGPAADWSSMGVPVVESMTTHFA